ncbi:WD40-repeat-containing domain protein [Suillus americanus]|nr:WD40-repeat-containing domain protein [Suillus americanus]
MRLWDIDTCTIIAKWAGHTNYVISVCWSRDGRNVLSGSSDGTARQWDVESGETTLFLEQIVTGHNHVYAAVYSPDTTLIATGGYDGPQTGETVESSIKVWDAKTGEVVTTLKGHTDALRCLAWTKDGKTLISGSFDNSIRTWNTKTWKQTAVLLGHTSAVYAIAISPNDRILASASSGHTAQLWNLDNGQPISSTLQHPDQVTCISFSVDGKRLATGGFDKNVYTWDVAAIVREAGLEDLLSDPKANKPALHSDATRRSVQRRPPAHRVTQGFFDGVPAGPSRFSAQSGHHSQGRTLLRRLFHRSPSNAQDTLPSSPLDWAGNLLKRHRQSDEDTELQGRSQVVEVPYAKGKRRNACAREKRKRLLPLKNSTASSSRPPKPNATQQSGTATQTPSSEPQPAVSTTPAMSNNAVATSRPDVMLRQAGLWTRFWLFIGCLSPEYQDGRH